MVGLSGRQVSECEGQPQTRFNTVSIVRVVLADTGGWDSPEAHATWLPPFSTGSLTNPHFLLWAPLWVGHNNHTPVFSRSMATPSIFSVFFYFFFCVEPGRPAQYHEPSAYCLALVVGQKGLMPWWMITPLEGVLQVMWTVGHLTPDWWHQLWSTLYVYVDIHSAMQLHCKWCLEPFFDPVNNIGLTPRSLNTQPWRSLGGGPSMLS